MLSLSVLRSGAKRCEGCFLAVCDDLNEANFMQTEHHVVIRGPNVLRRPSNLQPIV